MIPQEIYYLTDGAGRQYAVAEATGSIRTEIWNESASQYLGARATGAVTQSHSFGEERLSTPRTPGLSYFRNRVYDQDTGRWTQEDPIGIAGGINLYQFNGNDPATYGDPYGLCEPKPDCETIVAIFQTLGTAAGFLLGGGTGLVETAASGGLLAPAAVARTMVATTAGAGIGRAVGEIASDIVQFAKGGGDEMRGGPKSRRDPAYERLARDRRPTRAQRTRIHHEIERRKQGRRDLDPEELQEVFDDVMGTPE